MLSSHLCHASLLVGWLAPMNLASGSFEVPLLSSVVARQQASIPDFVTRYAPLVYIDVNDPYLPSDIGAQITNTEPELNFTRITSGPSNLDLSNLAKINDAGSCTTFDDCDIYLTSRDNVTLRPPWLKGVLPNPQTGETPGAVSSAVIVNDHDGSGTVDAFYFYFYAFNQGVNLSGTVLGNHVGDWEHTMLRFVDGEPQTMWYSAHSGGFTYTYDAVSKNGSRPLVYASQGGHANYPTPGLQTRKEAGGAITLNDTTSAGPLWDPVASAYFYTFSPTSEENGTFTPADSTGAAAGSPPPTSWLYFLGRWGDKRYPDSNPSQINLANISFAYGDGPTGPLDKDLDRNGTCPDSKQPCMTTTVLPSPSGDIMPIQTITRNDSSATATSTSTATGSGSGTGTTSASSSPSAFPGENSADKPGTGYCGMLALAVLTLFIAAHVGS